MFLSGANPRSYPLSTTLKLTQLKKLLPFDFQLEELLSLPVIVRPPIRLSVRELSLVRTITRHRF